MGLDPYNVIITGIAGLVAGLATLQVVQELLRSKSRIQKERHKPYSVRLTELTTSLNKASREVNSVLEELAQVSKNREDAVRKVEGDLSMLERRAAFIYPLQNRSQRCATTRHIIKYHEE